MKMRMKKFKLVLYREFKRSYDAKQWIILLLTIGLIATIVFLAPQVVSNSRCSVGYVSGIQGSFIEFTSIDYIKTVYVLDSNIYLNGDSVNSIYKQIQAAYEANKLCIVYTHGIEIKRIMLFRSIYYVNCVDHVYNIP